MKIPPCKRAMKNFCCKFRRTIVSMDPWPQPYHTPVGWTECLLWVDDTFVHGDSQMRNYGRVGKEWRSAQELMSQQRITGVTRQRKNRLHKDSDRGREMEGGGVKGWSCCCCQEVWRKRQGSVRNRRDCSQCHGSSDCHQEPPASEWEYACAHTPIRIICHWNHINLHTQCKEYDFRNTNTHTFKQAKISHTGSKHTHHYYVHRHTHRPTHTHVALTEMDIVHHHHQQLWIYSGPSDFSF